MAAENVIDFREFGLNVENISNVGEDKIKTIGKTVVDCFKTYGFCYLKNHGVDQKLLEDYMQVSKVLFNQPEKIKERYAMSSEYMFGWMKLGKERSNPERSVGDLHEDFNFMPLYESNWPPVDNFAILTKKVYEVTGRLVYRFLDVFSSGLELPIDFMRQAHGDNCFQLRTIYYPPIRETWSLAEDQVRLGEHSDWGSMTFSFQDSVGGLEVQDPTGEYIPAVPITDTVAVYPGDLLQRWTADTIKTACHRILLPDDERRKKGRQSIIMFVMPNMDCKIECLDKSGKYEPITVKEYVGSKAKHQWGMER